MNPKNVEWFADAIAMGAVKLPELQGQYQSLQNKVRGIQHIDLVNQTTKMEANILLWIKGNLTLNGTFELEFEHTVIIIQFCNNYDCYVIL